MANRERGETTLIVNNERSSYHGREFTLKLGMNAAVSLEQKTKKRIGQLIQESTALSFESMRYIVWMLLQKFHAADFKTPEQAGDLLDDIGMGQFGSILQQVAEVNQPDTTDPQPAQGGNGDDSTSPRDALPH